MTPFPSENAAAPQGELPEGEIHLWKVDLHAWVCADALALLSAEERAVAVRRRNPAVRARFVARRAALRKVLGRYAGDPPAALRFATNAYGKPALCGLPARTGLAFSTSHSGTLAVIAVAAAEPIGIDLEELRDDIEIDEIAARFFAPGEIAAIAALHGSQRTLAFYNAWTRKEAVVKALGKGLSIALDRFEVSVRPGAEPAVIRCAFDPQLGESLRLRHLEIGNGHVGALASGAGKLTVRSYDAIDINRNLR